MKDKVLILEDDKITQLVIQQALSNCNFDVTYSESIQEATALLRTNRYDAGLLDYYVGDGTALEIIENFRDIPSIILTSANDLNLAIASLRKGARHFIVKDHQTEYLSKLEIEIRNVIRESRAEKLIAEANQKINGLLEKLQASINYARRIQQAMLPSEKKIIEAFPRNFVLYKPKDVVSGDFYWFAKTRGFSFHACADCTGHGVPGSLLSMLGTEMLNKIILLGVTSPELILTELNTQFTRLLSKDEDGVDDGMDIALITFDHKRKVVEFSGGHNSLFYTTGGEIVELKGERQSIGGRRGPKEFYFSKQTLPIDAPTTIYLASDGFIDQFGGPENRKFTRVRFKRTLKEISHLPLTEQKTMLSLMFDEWMEGQRQLDDVTVTAVQVG